MPSRSSTQVELVQRLNHDDTYEIGGNIGWSTQIGNFQALVNAESRPNYENRDNREVRVTPGGELLGTLLKRIFAIRIGDPQHQHELWPRAHRMQLNAQLQQGDFPRGIQRDFVDFVDDGHRKHSARADR